MNNSSLSCEGIILRVIKYKNNQAIFRLITPNLGIIQCAVKGLGNNKNNFSGTISNLNYLQLELKQYPASEIYNVRSAHLVSSLANMQDYECFRFQSAACEIFTKIDSYPEEDFLPLFNLIMNYLTYLPKIEKNHIAIFWRFLLHYYYILGITLDLRNCQECSQVYKETIHYSLESHNFVCSACAKNNKTKNISSSAQELLRALPQIGNSIDNLTIADDIKKEINEILLSHLSRNLHKDIYLRSIDL